MPKQGQPQTSGGTKEATIIWTWAEDWSERDRYCAEVMGETATGGAPTQPPASLILVTFPVNKNSWARQSSQDILDF